MFKSLNKSCTLALSFLALVSPTMAVAQPLEVQNVDGISFVSGGVGDESMAELNEIEKQFDLKLFLVSKSGTYLSDINVTISDSHGNGVLLTTSKGPVLLANLPSGAYTVKATKNGNTDVQMLNVTRGQLRTVYVRFPDE